MDNHQNSESFSSFTNHFDLEDQTEIDNNQAR